MKTEFLQSLENNVNNFKFQKSHKIQKLHELINEQNKIKREIYQEQIEKLSDFYYQFVIYHLKIHSKIGKREIFLALNKKDFNIGYCVNIQYNCRLMMKKMLNKYQETIKGLRYKIIMNSQLVLHISW